MALDTLEKPPPTVGAQAEAAGVIDADVAAALEHGARGALVLSGIAVGLLFVGWLAFYFLLFMPRGAVG